jgi:predicted Zn-dependent protease
MSEYHCRIYGEGGAEAQSTHLHVDSDQLRLTDSAYSNYRLPFNKVTVALVGSSPYCVQLKVDGQDLTIVLTDLSILNELETTAAGTDLANQASKLKASLVSRHRDNRKQWQIVAAALVVVPIITLLLLDSTINLAIAQMDPKFEGRLGSWIAQSEPFHKSSERQEHVQRIGEKLVAKIHNVPYKFQFFVDNNPQVNACAYPGGVVVVNSGLAEAADDDEMAGVIGHEIGHVLHRDTLRATLHNLGFGLSFSVFMHLIGLGGDNGDLKGKHVAELMQSLESLSFSRAQEAAADQEGVRLAMKAGYSGDGLVKFFEKEKAKKGHSDGVTEKLTGLFSTHPLDQQRIEAIELEIEKIKTEERSK